MADTDGSGSVEFEEFLEMICDQMEVCEIFLPFSPHVQSRPILTGCFICEIFCHFHLMSKAAPLEFWPGRLFSRSPIKKLSSLSTFSFLWNIEFYLVCFFNFNKISWSPIKKLSSLSASPRPEIKKPRNKKSQEIQNIFPGHPSRNWAASQNVKDPFFHFLALFMKYELLLCFFLFNFSLKK